MNFDVFTLAAVTDELNDKLSGGRVQDSLEIGNEAVGLEIYAGHTRHYLLVSAHPQEARLHLAPDRLRRGVEHPSPLGLLMRRHLEGAFLRKVSQPPWERVAHLEFDGPEGPITLIAETMDRRSNILLVRDGKILDCVRRVGPDENRVRVSLPGHEYAPPPPQPLKRPPTKLTLALLADMLDGNPEKVAWRLLTEQLLGFSPMLAREAIYRAAQRLEGVRAADVSARALLDVIAGLTDQLMHGQFEPGVAEENGLVRAYAAYEITHLPGWRPTEGISAALVAFHGAPVGAEAYEAAKAPVRAQIDEASERVTRRLESLRRQASDESERERLRQSGELILAYQYQVKPRQTELVAQYDFDAPPLTIALDPSLTAVENARAYFERYDKAKRAAAGVPSLIQAAENELAFLKQLSTDLTLAANWPEIAEVQETLQANGYWRGPRAAGPRGGKSAPLKVTTPEGIVIWVGRNSRQNDEVTFSKGRPEDLWLHARGVPGAHVVIKSGGRRVPGAVIDRAAGLAAYYSAARGEGRALVDVTERRYVRKIKGGKPGMVTYRNESPVEATPAGER
ncbi:MAG: NFACT family protein [Anaerolineae bacterium]|nr:NFACT family protein [Anaerolineae bacterium]